MSNLADYLRKLPYFEQCPQTTLDLLAEQSIKRHFEAGESIFHEGDPSLGLWLIERGSVKIFKISIDGVEHILHLLGEGNSFNDIAAFGGGENPAHAAALSSTDVWLISLTSIDEALAADAALARRVIQLLALRVRGLVHRFEDLTLYGVVVRLARFLIQQADDPALSAPGVTRAAIAAYLAATPETISRALRTLEDGGAIRFDRHRIVIIREDLLRNLAAM